METAMLITLTIIAITSLLMNGAQWVERRIERKETEKFIREGARLEKILEDVQAELDNEKLHVSWAKGRIKDQQACIDALKTIKGTYKPKNERGQRN